MRSDLLQGTSASFGPETVKTMCNAFEEAWNEVGSQFTRAGLLAYSARQVLADAILQAAQRDRHQHADALKNAGLTALAATCKH